MDPIKIRDAHGPEWKIQYKHFIPFLRNRGWLVEVTQGNAYQSGFPDLYVCHPEQGSRWIDIKVEGHYQFTQAQKAKWPYWEKHGVGIWILAARGPEDCTRDKMEEEYAKLFDPPNWRDYWKDSYGEIDIHALLDDLYGPYQEPE